MKFVRRSGIGLVAALALAASLPAARPGAPPAVRRISATSASSSAACWNSKASEREFASKMNDARRSAGKSALRLDPELSRAARKHTAEMVNRNSLYHTPSSVLAKRVTNWSTLGENVGVGGTVSSLHSAFMNSPAHKDNILFSSFRYVGVGVKKDGSGRMWVTVIFEATSDPGTTLSMPRC